MRHRRPDYKKKKFKLNLLAEINAKILETKFSFAIGNNKQMFNKIANFVKKNLVLTNEPI